MSEAPKRSVRELIAERMAAKTQREPHMQGAPLGYKLKGASTLLDADGNVKAQWIKTAVDRDDPGLMLECFAEIAEERIVPRSTQPLLSESTFDDLIAVLPYGDPHMGMLSWHLETGQDFDLRIARQLMTDAARSLVSSTPACSEALVISVGDTVHIDNNENTTARGTRQDVDSRLPKIIDVTLWTFVEIIDCALAKHAKVRVIIVPGNHDPLTSMYLSKMLALYYRNEPRVDVDTSPSPHRYYQFGKCLFGVTHGDTVKMPALGELMAADEPELWGQTKYRHWYTGHVHHTQVKELRGCTAESLRTLAAKDAWHHLSGYRSGRSVFVDLWHREYGFRSRNSVGVAELERA